MITLCKIDGVPSDYNSMPFGRQIEFLRKIETFKSIAKQDWISQKRTPYKKAIREFIRLNNVKSYFCKFNADEYCFDDSFEIYYTQSP